jgi:hypothetical protein
MLSRSIIKRLSGEERNLLRDGSIYMGMITGAIAYFNYRQYIRKDFLRSEGHYRMQTRTSNITPWK